MNPILNSDQLNSEIDWLLYPFHRHNCDSNMAWFKGMTEAPPCNCNILKARAAIQTLINKARLQEIADFNDAVAANGWHNGSPEQFLYIANRIAELSTQEENNEH